MIPHALALAVTIFGDGGGYLPDYVRRAHSYRNREVRIVGECGSACTLFLGLPGACVSRGARVLFHGPSDGSEVWAEIMAQHYPAPFRDWFRVQWRRIDYDKPMVFSGSELIALGVAECAS